MLPTGHPRAQTRTGGRLTPLKRHDIRLRRLETIYREVIQESLARKVADSRLSSEVITVTRVKMSEDMNTAEVSYTLLHPEERKGIQKALIGAAAYFLSEIAQKVQIRTLPQIRFVYDSEHQEADDVVGLIDRLSRNAGRAPEPPPPKPAP